MQKGAIKRTGSGLSLFIAAVVGVVIVFLVVVVILWLWPRTVDVQIGGETFKAKLATSTGEQSRGLSGQKSLQKDQGMLFVFDTDSIWQFWMKDTYVNLDIIWLNSDQQIVGIVTNASPDSYPQTFSPLYPARYALEVPAGTAERLYSHLGERVNFSLPSIRGGIIKL